MYPSHLLRVSNNEEVQLGFNVGNAVFDLTRSNAHVFHNTEQIQQLDNWGDNSMVVASSLIDTSTDTEINGSNQILNNGVRTAAISPNCSAVSQEKGEDCRVIRRLAQNREAARKSRMRKKAYIQQLESSQIKLSQLEEELQQARQLGIFISGESLQDNVYSAGGNGALAFDAEYARWLDKHQLQISDLRSALNSQLGDEDLRVLVNALMSHYDELFRLKSIGTKSDVFHMLSGMWTTPAERCFIWMGGFRSSELLKVLAGHLEPLTDHQLMGICNLQQSSQEAEEALSQGMEALQQSLADSLVAAAPKHTVSSDNVANYMNQMTISMGKLTTLENFLRQADLLRQQTLHQMHRILTTHQAARALLVISDYFTRLRALSSLWLARPRG